MMFYAAMAAGLVLALVTGAALTFGVIAATKWYLKKPEAPTVSSHARLINEHAQAVANHARALALASHAQNVVDAAKVNVDTAAALVPKR